MLDFILGETADSSFTDILEIPESERRRLKAALLKIRQFAMGYHPIYDCTWQTTLSCYYGKVYGIENEFKNIQYSGSTVRDLMEKSSFDEYIHTRLAMKRLYELNKQYGLGCKLCPGLLVLEESEYHIPDKAEGTGSGHIPRNGKMLAFDCSLNVLELALEGNGTLCIDGYPTEYTAASLHILTALLGEYGSELPVLRIRFRLSDIEQFSKVIEFMDDNRSMIL